MSKLSLIDYIPVEGYLLTKPITNANQPKGWDLEDEGFPQVALVLAVGADTFYPNTDKVMKAPCKKGDIIVHSAAGFENLKIGGEEFRLIPFTRVLAVKK